MIRRWNNDLRKQLVLHVMPPLRKSKQEPPNGSNTVDLSVIKKEKPDDARRRPAKRLNAGVQRLGIVA